MLGPMAERHYPHAAHYKIARTCNQCGDASAEVIRVLTHEQFEFPMVQCLCLSCGHLAFRVDEIYEGAPLMEH